MIFFDAVVVGAGPSGATAARLLAEKGLKVLVLEKKKFPRYKTCGGGITGRALDLLPDTIKNSLECHCTRVDMKISSLGWSKSFERDIPIISMTMRSHFDHVLIKAAQDAGAQLNLNCALIDFVKTEEGYEVRFDGGSAICRWLVAADGVQSMVAKKAGFSQIRKYWPALEWEIFVKPEKLSLFKNRALFDLNFYPGGYAWVFPKAGHLSVGLGGPFSKNMNKALESFLIQENLGDYERAEKHGYLIPGERRSGPCAREGIFLVGDAAGFVDPLLGEGIYFGLLSAKLAAESMVESLSFPFDFAEDLYMIKAKNEVHPPLLSAEALCRLLHLHPWIQKKIFKRIGNHLANQMIDVVMGKKNYPKFSSGTLGAAWILAKRYVKGELSV